MIDLSFGFEQIWFDYSRNFVKFDEAAVKRRDISEKQFNWKRKASFYGRASLCAFNLLLCSLFFIFLAFLQLFFMTSLLSKSFAGENVKLFWPCLIEPILPWRTSQLPIESNVLVIVVTSSP